MSSLFLDLMVMLMTFLKWGAIGIAALFVTLFVVFLVMKAGTAGNLAAKKAFKEADEKKGEVR